MEAGNHRIDKIRGQLARQVWEGLVASDQNGLEGGIMVIFGGTGMRIFVQIHYYYYFLASILHYILFYKTVYFIQ